MTTPVVSQLPNHMSGADLLTLLLHQLSVDVPCQREDPELWFAQQPVMLEQAKRLCAGCPLRYECLEGALRRREPWGVWGGEIVEHGRIVQHKRPRGRPPKAVPEPIP